MQKCQYCDKEMIKGLKMHERYCKSKPVVVQDAPDTKIIEEPCKDIPMPEITPIIPPEQAKKGKSIAWAYKIVTGMIIFAGILQYAVFEFFKINKWLLVVVFLVDLLFYAFLIWSIYRLRKKAELVTFDTLEEFIKTVPKWAISEQAPNKGIIGSILNKGKQYKRIVLVSENFEPKMVWAEYNGFQFSIDNRGYKPARDVRGDFYFYHVDKKLPLIDTAELEPEDAEDSFQLDAVWNQAFSVGHAAAMSKTQGQIQLILILVGAAIIAIIVVGLYSYGQFGQIHKEIGDVYTISVNTSQLIRNEAMYLGH